MWQHLGPTAQATLVIIIIIIIIIKLFEKGKLYFHTFFAGPILNRINLSA
jgi:hypothetical protein